MSQIKAFYAKQRGVAPFWQKAVVSFIAGSLVGGTMHFFMSPNPMIPWVAAGVSAAVFYTFGKSAGK